jgi:hypothetical protein
VKPVLFLSVALCAALVAGAAAGAELPSRPAPGAPTAAATPAAKACQIDGEPGIMLPGSGACLRIAGSVTVQGAFGNVGGSRSNGVQ